MCLKSINIGQPTIECFLCEKIIHSGCTKTTDIVQIDSVNYCCDCSRSVGKRYNPFKILAESDTVRDDPRFYDNTPDSIPQHIHTASNILTACMSVPVTKLNNIVSGISTPTFSSYFLNIDGNQTNFDQFAYEISRFSFKFSAIGIAETNTSPSLCHLYQISDYISYYQDTYPDKHKGTGVALYLHNSLNAKVINNISHTTGNLESLFITITNTETPITIGVIYRPPNGDYNEFLKELEITKDLLPQHPVYIMGDYNIDLHMENCSMVNRFEDTILTSNLSPLISIYTHDRINSRRSCIDNILTNNLDNVIFSGTITESISDHKPVFQLSSHTITQPKTTKNVQYYDYSKSNVELFCKNLSSSAQRENLSHSFTQFSQTYQHCLDEACKLKKPKTTKRNQDNNPWFCPSIGNSIKTKEKLYKKWTRTRTTTNPDGNLTLYTDYSTYRQRLKHIIKFAKSKYYCGKIAENEGDSKKTWKIINQLRGKNNRAMKPQFVINNVRIMERRIIANSFNTYFTSLASNLNASLDNSHGIPITPLPHFSQYMPTPNPNSINMTDCSSTEVQKIILELANGKSSDIPVSIVKKTSPLISPLLANHFNSCMKEGIFPEHLKQAKVTPIYKKGNAEQLENYRPVSVLPIFGKIFEKVIYSRVYNFLVSQGILHDRQFGFREGHSTSAALNYSVEVIRKGLATKNHVLAIFIDLSKAFDTLDHSTLMAKLHTYGIRDNTHKLLHSYLSGRSQYISVLGENSDPLPIVYGVPQGSCLGPLLFLIYINDICRCSDLADFVLFADDTNVFVRAKSKKQVYEIANKVMEAIYNYMKVNKLHINMSKCCYMYFRPKKKSNKSPSSDIPSSATPVDQEHNEAFEEEIPLMIQDTVITQVREARFLGVIIDDELSWTSHINDLRKRLKCHIGSINRIKENIPQRLHKQIYHTLFESHLTYGITVWGGVSQSKMDPLLKLQKKCLRILFGDKEAYLDKFRTAARSRPRGSQYLTAEFFARENSKPLFNSNRILTVYNLHTYHITLEIFKLLKFKTPSSLRSLLQVSIRKETLLIKPQASHHFIFTASDIWNLVRKKTDLTDISPISSIGQFKTTIRGLILEHQKLGSATDWTDDEIDVKEALRYNRGPDYQYSTAETS